MIGFLIDDIFVECGGVILQQVIGIPMGTICAPLLADLLLYSYEAKFIQTLIQSGKRYLVKLFCFIYRYIDDVLLINNPKFGDYFNIIYPVELEIKDTTDADHHASYLDLLLKYDNFHRHQVKLYDKRDDFKFDIVNFPFLCSNIPQSPAYCLFISQLYLIFGMPAPLLCMRNCMAARVYWLTGLKFRSRILSLTCFLRRFTVDDLFLCHFTARAFNDIDV